MFFNSRCPRIPLPNGWSASVRCAVLHAIALAHYAITFTRSWAATCPNARLRLKAENDRLKAELALPVEQQRITDARMAQIPPHRRPQYPPTERMAILELKAARGWSLEQTAKAFLVTPATIASWMKRLDEEGPDALVQLRQPLNKFPDFVHYIVQRLKRLCPTMGKVKIAETLARAGLHLGSTTVGRMLKEKRRPFQPPVDETDEAAPERVVTAKYPGHIWHVDLVDLTVVPTGGGFWTSWLPCALPQCWPFGWWLAIAVDHFSRRVMGYAVFHQQPSSEQVRSMLGRAIAAAGRAPRYVVCDRGGQFDCRGFRAWCRRKGIKRPRYGAIGKSGSIAVVERVILTMKCVLSRLLLVPYRRDAFLREVTSVVQWYNQFRPHTGLGGGTPNEVYFGVFPANRKPRFEPRSRWPRASPCAQPWALVRGTPGAKLTLEVSYHRGRKHLPIITLKRAA